MFCKFKRFKSRMDNGKDRATNSLKSPPPQNPIYHKLKEISMIMAVKANENINIETSLNNVANVKLKINP